MKLIPSDEVGPTQWLASISRGDETDPQRNLPRLFERPKHIKGK